MRINLQSIRSGITQRNSKRTHSVEDKWSRVIGAGSLMIAFLLITLFLLPVGMILIQAFPPRVGGGISTGLFKELLHSPYTWRITTFTLIQASLSTLFSIIIGLPGAYILSHYNFRGKKLIKAIATVPFVLPSILVVLGFVMFYGNNGFLNRLLMIVFKTDDPPLQILYSFKAIILAHSFYNFPIALTIISTYWEQLSDHLEQAAYTLGAGRVRVFFTVTFPRLLPAILSAALLIFLFCFTSFAIILVLGGGPQFTTLEVEVYRLARISLDIQKAAAFSLFSSCLSLIILGLYIFTQRSFLQDERYSGLSAKKGSLIKKISQGKKKSIWIQTLIGLYTFFTSVFVLAPLAAVVIRSFQAPVRRTGKTVFTLSWYQKLFNTGQNDGAIFSSAAEAVLTSFKLAGAAVLLLIPVTLCVVLALKRMRPKQAAVTETLLMLPMAISSVILGLGFFIISRSFANSSLHLYLIVCAHAVIAFPFMLRAVLPNYRRISASYTAASMSLGASPLKTAWYIELPLLKRALISGAVFAGAISIGEFNATLILSDAQIVTIPIIMYRLIGSYNFYGACALGSVLIVLSLILFIVLQHIEKDDSL